MKLLLLVLLVASQAYASPKAIQEDVLLQEIETKIVEGRGGISCARSYPELTCEDQFNIWLAVASDLKDEGFSEHVLNGLLSQNWKELTFTQKVYFFKMLRELSPSHPLVDEIRKQLSLHKDLAATEAYIACEFVGPEFCSGEKISFAPPSRQLLQRLFKEHVDLSDFEGGKYAKAPRVYVFCRSRREYTCLIVLKDKNGDIVKRADGTVWSQPILAYSNHKKPFNEPNGNTPSGVWLIDGVMPAADQVDKFGKFRRLIMDFVPKSQNERKSKIFLPQSHHRLTWWKEAVTARDIGRSAFRLHGTGRRNDNRQSAYYGYFGTSGCLESRENAYDGFDYIHQRTLLDAVMVASGRTPNYNNETSILAVMYVVNIDAQPKPVLARDLRDLGLF